MSISILPEQKWEDGVVFLQLGAGCQKRNKSCSRRPITTQLICHESGEYPRSDGMIGWYSWVVLSDLIFKLTPLEESEVGTTFAPRGRMFPRNLLSMKWRMQSEGSSTIDQRVQE